MTTRLLLVLALAASVRAEDVAAVLAALPTPIAECRYLLDLATACADQCPCVRLQTACRVLEIKHGPITPDCAWPWCPRAPIHLIRLWGPP